MAVEVTLTLLTAASVLGLARLFTDGSSLLPLLLVTVAAHVTAGTCRRLRLSAMPTLVAATLGLTLLGSWLILPHTTVVGLPTPGTIAESVRGLSSAWTALDDLVAPVPARPGLLLAFALGVWMVAFLADTAAFRARGPVEAAVPAATLFVVGSALGAPRHRILTTAAFLVALVAYWLAQRLAGHAAAPAWRRGDRAPRGRRRLAVTGAAIGAGAVVAAVVVGPLLPGIEAQAVVPWRAGEREGPGSRVTVSPLVDIRSQLVDRSAVEVFTVRSDVRSYWRLTSLEIFDGRVWSSKGRYRPAEGGLPEAAPAPLTTTERGVQDFEIGQLSSFWLPAAYRPVAIDGTDARYDPASASLLTDETTAQGLRYTVRSDLPSLTAGDLGTAPPDGVAADIVGTYTALPPDFSLPVRREAERLVTGTSTAYERARALQDHFRDGGFTYDLEVQPGHSGSDLERFLFDTRRGYCEQFAGTYAAMARAVGLPARVAVGFTPGEVEEGGAYRVRGLNAHAWPEVYLAGYGWVPFEPTPGRGIPGAEAYTGVPEQQATPDDPTTATTAAPAAGAATSVPADAGPQPATRSEPATGPGPADEGSPGWRRLALAGAVLLGGPTLWLAAVEAVVRARRARRRAAASTPGQRILVAWQEVGEELAWSGRAPWAWETPAEYAGRASSVPGVDPVVVADLAELAAAASFGPGGMDDGLARRAVEGAARVRRSVLDDLGALGRIRRAADPRRLRSHPRGALRLRGDGQRQAGGPRGSAPAGAVGRRRSLTRPS
ncbi:MAG: transglutaminaseTgpA domain-containing protein [Acidimicrobiales bacterium]